MLTISTIDTDEVEDGNVKVEVLPGQGYQPGTSKSVAVTDNSAQITKYSVAVNVITMILKELPPTPPQESRYDGEPTISIKAVKEKVEEGESAVFAISTSLNVNTDIPIKVRLSQSGDFVIGSMIRSVVLTKDQLGIEMTVKTDDDRQAEADGRITATIQEGSDYLVGAENTAHVVVSDALDRQHRRNGVSNAMNAVLPDLLANSTARTLGIASERLTQAFSGSPTTSVELNSQFPALALLQSGGEMLNDGDTDWRSIIDDSSFTVALYPEGGQTSTATLWGVGDQWSLSDDGIGGQQSWDGEIHTGHFGFDAQVGHGVLAGLAMSVSNGEIDYGRVENSRMSFGKLTTGAHPYFGLATPDGISQLQIMAGYGESELELRQEDYSPVNLRSNFQSLGLSGSNRLYSNGSFGGMRNLELSVAGETWYSQQSVTDIEEVVDRLEVNVRHVRIAIEGSHNNGFSTGETVSHSFSIGMREDGRNDSSIYGMDIGSEIGYHVVNGFKVSGSGKSMLTGLNQVYKWHLDSSLNYDSKYDDL